MARFAVRRYTELLRTMVARVLARASGIGLRDIGDASAHKRVLASTARELDRTYYDMSLVRDEFDLRKCRGDALDERAKQIDGIEDDDATRILGLFAFGGSVVFSRVGTTGSVTIQRGTIVKSKTGLEFETVAQTQIDATSAQQIAGHGVGRDAAPVSVVARKIGTAGNVGIGSITAFGSKPAGVDEVTNLAPLSNGEDREQDEDFIERLLAAVARIGKCTRQAVAAAARKVKLASGQRVISAKLVEDFLVPGRKFLYIDDGAGTAKATAVVNNEVVTNGLLGPPPNTAVGGEEYLRLDYWPIDNTASFTVTSSVRGNITTTVTLSPTDGWLYFSPPLQAAESITASYTRFTGLIAEVQKVLDGDEPDATNYPGFDAAGSEIQVLAPTVLQQDFECTIAIAETAAASTVQAEVKDRVARYYNTLPIGADVVWAALIAIVKDTPGVLDVVLTVPPANQPIADDEVARIVSTNIDVLL